MSIDKIEHYVDELGERYIAKLTEKNAFKADIVRVVRCKDCVYCNEHYNVCHYGEGRDVKPDHYCGYGERKEVTEE